MSTMLFTPGLSQDVAVGAASVASAATTYGVNTLRLLSNTDCYVAIGATPVASAGAGMLLTGGVAEYFHVPTGAKVAAIQSTAAGTLNITEMSR